MSGFRVLGLRVLGFEGSGLLLRVISALTRPDPLSFLVLEGARRSECRVPLK